MVCALTPPKRSFNFLCIVHYTRPCAQHTRATLIMSSSGTRVAFRDALSTIGTLLTPGQEKRDAVHLPVLHVLAAEQLSPNQDIGILKDGQASAFADVLIGKVDPFLKTIVPRGAGFWMVLYPSRITSLRHVWRHPRIPDNDRVLANLDAQTNPSNSSPDDESTKSSGDASVASTSASSTTTAVSGDRRSVQTDAELGRLVQTARVKRDATHWPVCPVTASERLSPGTDVGFLPNGRVAAASDTVHALGKIDPFLTKIVEPGQECWFVVYPGQIRSLFHSWDHPHLPDAEEASSSTVQTNTTTVSTASVVHSQQTTEPTATAAAASATSSSVACDDEDDDEREREKAKASALTWISGYAALINLEADDLITAAEKFVFCGQSLRIESGWEDLRVSDDFWDQYEIVSGKELDSSDRGNFFESSPSYNNSYVPDTC
jgi:hypothetical protein